MNDNCVIGPVRMTRHLALLLLLLTLAACATPGVYPRGVRIEAPKFDGQGFVMSDGARLPARVWPADGKEPRAILIGLHGMDDYSNAFDTPAKFFAHDGITTYAFDQRCFGAAPHRAKWAGTPTMVEDLAEVTMIVRAEHPGVPVYLIGLSMGSAVILASAGAKELPPVDGAILVAPAVWGWGEMNIFYRMTLWAGAHTMPGKTLTGERVQVWPSDNIEMLRALGRDPLMITKTRIGSIYGLVSLMDRGFRGAGRLNVPALVLYGKKDQLVPAASVRNMAKRIPSQKRFVLYTNGYHMLERDLQAETVWRDIESWIGDHTAPLPSVAGLPHPVAEEVGLALPTAAAGN